MKVMNVTMNGSVRWKAYYWVFITNGLIKKESLLKKLVMVLGKYTIEMYFWDTSMKRI